MIVSLTTVPERIQHIKLCIESIKRQTKPATKILLWVPYTYKGKQEYDIPQFLYDEELVEIIRCEDHGPATKFIHTIKKIDPDEEFIVIDDDQIYSQYLIEDLTSAPFLTGAKSTKGTYWVNRDGPYGNLDKPGDDTAPNKQRKFVRNIIPEKLDYLNRYNFSTTPIICGCDGMLLKPSFFNKDIHNIQQQFFNCDDIWLSGYLESHKIKKYTVPCRQITYDKTFLKEHKIRVWDDTPVDIVEGGMIRDYPFDPVYKPKKSLIHLQYLSRVSRINGGKYERVGIYNEAYNETLKQLDS